MALAALHRATSAHWLASVTLQVPAAALRARKRRWARVALRGHLGKVIPGYTTGPWELLIE